MTEKEEKASEKILKEIAILRTELQALKMSNKSEEHEKVSMDTQGHKTIEEMLECPNCYPKLRDGVAKKEGFIKPIGKRDRHEYDKICKGCGLRGKKDEEKCPSCGSTDYY